jgi:hypothetical protein
MNFLNSSEFKSYCFGISMNVCQSIVWEESGELRSHYNEAVPSVCTRNVPLPSGQENRHYQGGNEFDKNFGQEWGGSAKVVNVYL